MCFQVPLEFIVDQLFLFCNCNLTFINRHFKKTLYSLFLCVLFVSIAMTIIFSLVAISRRDLNVLENSLAANPSISRDIARFGSPSTEKTVKPIQYSKLCASLSLFPVFSAVFQFETHCCFRL